MHVRSLVPVISTEVKAWTQIAQFQAYRTKKQKQNKKHRLNRVLDFSMRTCSVFSSISFAHPFRDLEVDYLFASHKLSSSA